MWNEYFIEQPIRAQHLHDQVMQGKLPHAMLFYGPEGAGQLVHALYTAMALMCQSEDKPCMTCNSCKKVIQLTHPDLHFLLPTTGADKISQDVYPQWRDVLAEQPYLSAYQWMQALNSDRKQGNINAKDCLKVYQTMNMQSYEGGAKVLIIWMAEYLGRDGNRLLKLIEEPPENTYLILVAENRELILSTILSRCQQYYFPPYQIEQVVVALKKVKSLSDTEAQNVARVSEGNLKSALELTEIANTNFEQLMGEWIKATYHKDPGERVRWTDAMSKRSKEEQKQFLRYILKMMRLALTGQYNADEKMLVFLNQKLDVERIEMICNVINQSISQINRNANPKINWMRNSIVMNQILHQRASASLLQTI